MFHPSYVTPFGNTHDHLGYANLPAKQYKIISTGNYYEHKLKALNNILKTVTCSSLQLRIKYRI